MQDQQTATQNRCNGAQYLATNLKQLGVSHVFFIDAVLRRTLVELEALGVSRILAHSEKAAAYMADGYARASGRPGVCMAQSVGAANLAAGLQDAYLHRSPVIALTGRKPASFRYRNAYQEVDHAPLFAPMTKYSAAVDSASQLPLLLTQAFKEATTGTLRPVHLDLCGLQAEVIETETLTDAASVPARFGKTHGRTIHADAADLETARAMLSASQRPVLVCGAGALHDAARAAVLALCETLRIPVATTTGGRGVIPTNHPCHIGVVGNYSAPPTNRTVHAADLVVFVGSHTSDQTTLDWTVPGQDKAIIHIDVDCAEIGRNYPRAHGVWGDPASVLNSLRDSLANHPAFSAWAQEAATPYQEWKQQIVNAPRPVGAIAVETLCHAIGQALPQNGIVVADTGYSTIWSANLIELPHPGQSYFRAAGSLGWAFPAAIGMQLACPDRPVVCFSGDGAFYYHLTELETAARRNIPLVTVINNNSGFGQCLYNIRNIYGDRPGNADEMMSFGPTDFAALARNFGVDAIRVEDARELAPALRKALESRKPFLIDVVTDRAPRAPEPWNPASAQTA